MWTCLFPSIVANCLVPTLRISFLCDPQITRHLKKAIYIVVSETNARSPSNDSEGVATNPERGITAAGTGPAPIRPTSFRPTTSYHQNQKHSQHAHRRQPNSSPSTSLHPCGNETNKRSPRDLSYRSALFLVCCPCLSPMRRQTISNSTRWWYSS